MTPLQRAEANQGEDVMLLIFSATALVTVGYVLFGAEDIGLLWVAIISLTINIAALFMRFKRPLH